LDMMMHHPVCIECTMMLHKLIRNITLLELTRLNKNDFSFVFFKTENPDLCRELSHGECF
jgi:hypothetical protein